MPVWSQLARKKGTYVLACCLAHYKLARHQALNDLIGRAISSTDIPSTKETNGLSSKRPDDLALIPSNSGKPITWDVTGSSFFDRLLFICIIDCRKRSRSSSEPERGEILQCSRCILLPATRLRGNDRSTSDFLQDLGSELEMKSGDGSERIFLAPSMSLICTGGHSCFAFNQ